MKNINYMDFAAATPIDADVLGAMSPYFSDKFYNPSAIYLASRAIKQDIEKARLKVGQVLGVRPSEIIFTAGGTEANNLAIHGIMQQFPKGHLVVSAIEHESILQPTLQYDHSLVPVKPEGIVDLKKLAKLVNDNTILVSIMYANNEMGSIQPIREIAKIIGEIKRERIKRGNKSPLYIHTDACQAANYLDLHINRLGVDLMTLNGGKIYGPKQSGALFVKAGINLKPQITGGGQEKGLRSGTENVPGIIGFSAALIKAQQMHTEETKRLRSLQSLFFKLIEEYIPDAKINGSLKHRLPNNVHITFPGYDNERLMMELDEKGIQCAVGSACSASNEEPSHVLRAMGMNDKDAQASLRFTMGRSTSEEQIRKVVNTLAACL